MECFEIIEGIVNIVWILWNEEVLTCMKSRRILGLRYSAELEILKIWKKFTASLDIYPDFIIIKTGITTIVVSKRGVGWLQGNIAGRGIPSRSS